MKAFITYLVLCFLSLIGVTVVNIGDYYKCIDGETLDYLYGNSIAIIITSGMFYSWYLTRKHANQYRTIKISFTMFFFFLSLTNFMDELLFDPYNMNFYEYFTALIILISTVHVVNRTEKTRN